MATVATIKSVCSSVKEMSQSSEKASEGKPDPILSMKYDPISHKISELGHKVLFLYSSQRRLLNTKGSGN